MVNSNGTFDSLGITFVEEEGYRKNAKTSDTRKFAVITLNVEQYGFSLE